MIRNLIAIAPQPVDTTEQGPLGFILLAVLCTAIMASLFYMDRIRQRASDRRDSEQ